MHVHNQDTGMLRVLHEDDLLLLWFAIGEQNPWEQSQWFIEAVREELVRRKMPVILNTGI